MEPFRESTNLYNIKPTQITSKSVLGPVKLYSILSRQRKNTEAMNVIL